jgi:hypothetical protein
MFFGVPPYSWCAAAGRLRRIGFVWGQTSVNKTFAAPPPPPATSTSFCFLASHLATCCSLPFVHVSNVVHAQGTATPFTGLLWEMRPQFGSIQHCGLVSARLCHPGTRLKYPCCWEDPLCKSQRRNGVIRFSCNPEPPLDRCRAHSWTSQGESSSAFSDEPLACFTRAWPADHR